MINAKYFPRELEKKIKKYLPLPEILAIVGPRRSGKTTFLAHTAKSLSRCAYITFENETLVDLFDLEIDKFAARFLPEGQTLIIDEFQHAKRGGKNLKYLYDLYPGRKIIISGSSSPDLTIKALKFLTGRCLVFTLYPFNFSEFLSTKEPHPADKELRACFEEYVTFGGYPEVVLQKDPEIKKTLLQNIYSLFFSREVKDMTSLSDDYRLKNLLRALAISPGGLIEYRELMQISGFDFLTLKKYLNFLAKTFIAFPVFPFFTNRRTELVKNPKIYFYDLGLRNSLIANFISFDARPDKDWLVENFVAAGLQTSGKDPHFWRTKNKAEVDFITQSEGQLVAYETKAGEETNVSPALVSFIQKYRPTESFIINTRSSRSRKIGETTVHFVPLTATV